MEHGSDIFPEGAARRPRYTILEPMTGQRVLVDIPSLAIATLHRIRNISRVDTRWPVSPLHIVFCAERLLLSLQRAQWNVILVFLEESADYLRRYLTQHPMDQFSILSLIFYLCQPGFPIKILLKKKRNGMSDVVLWKFGRIGARDLPVRSFLLEGLKVVSGVAYGFELTPRHGTKMQDWPLIESPAIAFQGLSNDSRRDDMQLSTAWSLARNLLSSIMHTGDSIHTSFVIACLAINIGLKRGVPWRDLRALAIQSVLVRSLSVSMRARLCKVANSEHTTRFLRVQSLVCTVLKAFPGFIAEHSPLDCDPTIGDVLDYGVWQAAAHALEHGADLCSSHRDKQVMKGIWEVAHTLAGKDSLCAEGSALDFRILLSSSMSSPPTVCLSHVSNELIEKMCGNLQSSLEGHDFIRQQDDNAVGDDDRHLQLSDEHLNRLVSKPIVSDSGWERKEQDRQQQKMATYMKRFADSQTLSSNTCGNIVMARFDSGRNSKRMATSSNQAQRKHKDGGKPSLADSGKKSNCKKKGGSKCASGQLRKQQILSKQREKKIASDNQLLKKKVTNLKSSSNDSILLLYAKLMRDPTTKRMEEPVRALVEIDFVRECYAQLRKGKSNADFMRAVTFRKTIDLLEIYRDYLTNETRMEMCTELSAIGFPAIAQQFAPELNLQSRQSSFSPQIFQLQHCGVHMKRSFGAQPDGRVDGFEPDAWQRRLLDAVDNQQSALVVAPTSSGKTFISYYVMQKCIKDAAGMVIYVAPTQALVNQVAAEVLCRVPKAKVGIFTRDFQYNVDSCNVLTCVPQVLEILLLNARWRRKLFYVVLDEVHCIGERESANRDDALASSVVWERIILLLQCPILALSATMTETIQFHSWLERVQSDQGGRKVVLIEHSKRWSDLCYLTFNAKEHRFDNLHSMRLASSSFDLDGLLRIPLSPRECYVLWKQLATLLPELPRPYTRELSTLVSMTEQLDPRSFFNESEIIDRSRVYTYEEELKTALSSLKSDRVAASIFSSIFGGKSASMQKLQTQFESSQRSAKSTFVDKMMALKEHNHIPVIVFSLDRMECVRRCAELYCAMVKLEESDESFQAAVRLAEEQSQRLEKLQKQMKRKQKKEVFDQEAGEKWNPMEEAEEAFRTQCVFPRSRHHFRPAMHADSRDLEYWINRAKYAVGEDSWLIGALERGIAVHHAGLSAKYRQAVEVYMRCGLIGVVVATTTLALGLNVPCKTVVLWRDGPYMNPLMFRQMIGRAGRRGFDDFGRVVFAGYHPSRIQALVTGSLRPIRGTANLSPAFVLRMLTCFDMGNKKQQQDMLQSFPRLVTHSLRATSSTSIDVSRQQRVLFRIYLEFLVFCGLIDHNGRPVNFSSLVCRLHYHEPMIGLFVKLMRDNKDSLTAICRDFNQYKEHTSRSLLTVLSHFFNQIPLFQPKDPAINYSPSVLTLPALEKISAELANAKLAACNDIEALFVATMKQFCPVEVVQDQDSAPSLPLSNWNPRTCPEQRTDGAESLFALLPPGPLLRSPYAALSGLDDESFHGKMDIYETSRTCLGLELDMIPLPDAYSSEDPLNSAALDFYKHQQAGAMSKLHGLKQGHDFRYLKDWMMLLKAINTALGETAMVMDQCVHDTFRYLSDEFEMRLHAAYY